MERTVSLRFKRADGSEHTRNAILVMPDSITDQRRRACFDA